jgi:hypothetical protein
VLLYALRHPERSSEQATDSVPLVLGFGAIVARGRQAVTRIEHRSATATRTTTFGYLSDEEFAAATRLVAVRLAERVDRENVVHASSVALRRRLAVLESRIRRLRQVTQVSDHRGTKVRNVDAQRLVAMHASDYFDDLERRTIATVKAMAQAERLRTKLALPTERAIERLDRLRDFLTSESDRLATLEETVRADFRAAVRSQPAFARTLFTMGDALESLRTHITPPPHNER